MWYGSHQILDEERLKGLAFLRPSLWLVLGGFGTLIHMGYPPALGSSWFGGISNSHGDVRVLRVRT